LYKRKPYDIDHRILLQDGTERTVHEQAEFNFNDNGDPIGMVGTVQDITERKRVENVLSARVKQQAAVAQIGKLALEEGINLSTLFDLTTAIVAQSMNLELAMLQVACVNRSQIHEWKRQIITRQVSSVQYLEAPQIKLYHRHGQI